VVTDILDLMTQDILRLMGPERENPLSRRLREIRSILTEAARAGGLDEPWLGEWWLHIDKARNGVREARW
jgi:hypothetical protein